MLFTAWCWFAGEKRRAANALRMRLTYARDREKRQASNRGYALAHPEVIAAIKQRYQDKHRAEISAKAAERYRQNSEAKKAATRAWRLKNPERRAAWAKEYRRLNREKIRAGIQKWITANYERWVATRRRRRAERRATDPQWVIRHNLAKRMWAAVRGKAKKSASTELLIGCDFGSLQAHIESQFQPGMSWDNYGEWQIDHIRPCAAFDLIDPEQQRACFCYTNLQPLWAKDNRAKSDTYAA